MMTKTQISIATGCVSGVCVATVPFMAHGSPLLILTTFAIGFLVPVATIAFVTGGSQDGDTES